MPNLREQSPIPDPHGTDSSGYPKTKISSPSSSSDSKSNSNSKSNSDSLSARSHQSRSNIMPDIREKKMRAKQERIFTNTNPFSLTSPSQREQEYPVSPKSLPSRGALHGAMVEKKDEEVQAQKGSKQAHQNYDDDDGSWSACQETRSVAVARCSTTGASANLVDQGKEGSEGEAVVASASAGTLKIAGLPSIRKTQESDEERGRRGAIIANVKAYIMTIAGLKTAEQTQEAHGKVMQEHED